MVKTQHALIEAIGAFKQKYTQQHSQKEKNKNEIELKTYIVKKKQVKSSSIKGQ